METRTRAEAARAVLDLRAQYLAVTAASLIAIDPRTSLLSAFRSAFPENPAPTLELPGPNGQTAIFPLTDVLQEASSMGWEPMQVIVSTAQLATGAQLGEIVRALDLTKSERETDLFQFVRHYRNGCAHDGRWLIEKKKFQPGEFAGVAVSLGDHGKRVTDKVTPYLHVRLIEAVADHLGPPAVRDTVDGWRPNGEGFLAGRPRPMTRINTMPPIRE